MLAMLMKIEVADDDQVIRTIRKIKICLRVVLLVYGIITVLPHYAYVFKSSFTMVFSNSWTGSNSQINMILCWVFRFVNTIFILWFVIILTGLFVLLCACSR